MPATSSAIALNMANKGAKSRRDGAPGGSTKTASSQLAREFGHIARARLPFVGQVLQLFCFAGTADLTQRLSLGKRARRAAHAFVEAPLP